MIFTDSLIFLRFKKVFIKAGVTFLSHSYSQNYPQELWTAAPRLFFSSLAPEKNGGRDEVDRKSQEIMSENSEGHFSEKEELTAGEVCTSWRKGVGYAHHLRCYFNSAQKLFVFWL